MKIKALFLAVLFLVPIAAANATVISYKLDTEFSNSGAAALSGPLFVSFDDGGTAGSVTMTVDATNLSGNEHVKNLYINIDSAIGPFGVWGAVNAASSWSSYALSKDPDKTKHTDGVKLKADGVGGYYDMKFDFGSPQGMSAGKKFIYDFFGSASLVASSFDFTSFDGTGLYAPYTLASHIGGIGSNGDSGWYTAVEVPAPAPVLLMMLGLLGLAANRAMKKV